MADLATPYIALRFSIVHDNRFRRVPRLWSVQHDPPAPCARSPPVEVMNALTQEIFADQRGRPCAAHRGIRRPGDACASCGANFRRESTINPRLLERLASLSYRKGESRSRPSYGG